MTRTLRRLMHPVFIAGMLASVVIIEPAPIDLFVVALSGWWIIHERLPVSRLALGIGLVYVACSALSQVIGGMNNSPFNAAIVRDLGVEAYLVITAVCLHAKFRESPETMTRFVRGIVLGAVAISVAFLALKLFFRVPDILYRDEFRVRVRGLFKDPNVLGPFLVFPIAALAFKNEVVNVRGGRLLAIPCMVLLALTYSRGAYVGILATTAIIVVVILSTERITVNGALGTVVGIIGVFVALTFVWSTSGVPEVEVNTNRLAYQDYDSHRFSTLGAAFDYIVSHPFGNGIRAFAIQHGSNPHNLFLGKATDAGVLAGAIVILVPAIGAMKSIFARRSPYPRFQLIVGASLAGNLVVSSVIYAHHWRHIFFLTAISFALGLAGPRPVTAVGRKQIELDATAVDIRLRAESLGARS